jgi:CspA family cold shock protein
VRIPILEKIVVSWPEGENIAVFSFDHDTTCRTSVNRQEGLATVAMSKGTVDFFNDTGGYGFISTDDADDDVFFHMEDVGGPDLEEGQDVEFEIEDAPKGPRATNVVRN